jgi:cell division septum initiation protein DivIVA
MSVEEDDVKIRLYDHLKDYNKRLKAEIDRLNQTISEGIEVVHNLKAKNIILKTEIEQLQWWHEHGQKLRNAIYPLNEHLNLGMSDQEVEQAPKIALAAVERMERALEKIVQWEFDIMGDCVTDARKVARDALKEGKDA